MSFLLTLHEWDDFLLSKGSESKFPEMHVFRRGDVEVRVNLLDNGDHVEMIQVIHDGDSQFLSLDKDEDAERQISLLADAMRDRAMAPALAGIEWVAPIMEKLLKCS